MKSEENVRKCPQCKQDMVCKNGEPDRQIMVTPPNSYISVPASLYICVHCKTAVFELI